MEHSDVHRPIAMPPSEDDVAWLKSTFHPIPKPQVPDDSVEYSLYVISKTLDPLNDSETRNRLREVQREAARLQQQWLKDYIWQRQSFGLELVKEDGEVCCHDTKSNHEHADNFPTGVTLLRGRTEYGDSVEDEWVVVWILRELTKKFTDLWVKIVDNDGEFLLIEAAGTLPKWLEPEVAENRVWIHDGGLVIIQPLPSLLKTIKNKPDAAGKISLQDAQRIMLKEPKRLMVSASIEEEAFYRLRNYPGQIAENMHHALVTLPRRVVFLLYQKPGYIAPATEAFYLRDPIALKPLQQKDNKNLFFEPKDMVTVSVRFPRVGYAQLKSQEFPAPVVWAGKIPSKSESKEDTRAELGMKVSCGLEMLLSDSHHQDKPAVREMRMLIEDLESGDEKLPTDEEIATWDRREDDEKWLDISFDDLEGELAGKEGKVGATRGDFGDKAAQENLHRIVSQFESFLNDDKAGPDGAGMFEEDSDADSEDIEELDNEDDDDDEEGEDKEASFDEDEFTKMMREMMGMPSEVMREMMGSAGTKKPTEKKGEPPRQVATSSSKVEELDSDEDSEDEQKMESVMKRMEAELNETGVLNLDPTPRKMGAAQMAIREKASADGAKDHEESDEDSDDGEENDMDVNLVKNMLESFKSQAGMAGPGGNLMGLMGVNMPRDEEASSSRSPGKE